MSLSSSLHAHFGFDSFRAGQEDAIHSLLNKQHTLAIMPTGAETGGTWAGATEALKNNWLPVFVLEHDAMPAGNKLLLQKGALPFPHPFKDAPVKLPAWLKEKAASLPAMSNQLNLF